MTKNQWTLAVVGGVFSTALVGGAALAGVQQLQPTTDDQTTSPAGTAAEQDRAKPGDHLKAILDKLVSGGTITQAQEDAILKAVADDAAANRPKGGFHFNSLGDIFKAARDYIGISQQDLMTQLRAGNSLADIAVKNGKTRQGLIDAITNAANAKIDKAQQDGKLTADQATQLKAKVTASVGQLVDRKGFGGHKSFGPNGSPRPTPTAGPGQTG